jgi:hypothetical protein
MPGKGSVGHGDMLNLIKGVFLREKGFPKAQVESLGKLPPGERLAGVGVALHDLCVETAARFVEEEHRRPDSPFRELPKTDLFHEMLVMNFWILESLFKGKRQALMDHLYLRYNTSFVWGWESSGKELMDSMLGKFKAYSRAWDNYTGHQDLFAREAIGIIFGERGCAEPSQAAFWLITHADRTMKDFAEVGKSVNLLLQDAAGTPRSVPPRFPRGPGDRPAAQPPTEPTEGASGRNDTRRKT